MAGRHDDVVGGDGRRLRWQEHNHARQQVIIDAAVRVLERAEPGHEVQVQQIADEAGLARTVIYRHFHDRTELDRAVQERICADLGARLLPQLSYDDRPVEVIRRVVHALVTWAEEHRTLFWFAELDLPGPGPGPCPRRPSRSSGGSRS
ncbi:TetR family transcriptional regulator [Nocardioides sp. TF02-7]|uniref:TetR/AcrR family transcriptional regulator n=1 Tax=Nocardioides sp. TF02-7 TaxID=2917724 RepID=UPI001F051E84|nr:TetR family transcriptional regulator [Nocardioides sp. TF02-7]UMG92656.1 TetR/AcrR family transcriptional regulator [Nocardioides sp. TF02-7]